MRSSRWCAAGAAAVLATGLFATEAAAADPASTKANDRVTYDLGIDLPITFAAGSIWLGTQLLQIQLASAECRWCDRNDDGSDALNGLDKGARNAFRWSDPLLANTLSDILGYAVSPAVALGAPALVGHLDGRFDEAAANALLILEATFIASLGAQIAKFAIARERPFVHYLPEREKKLTWKPSDNNVSFYSAHANFSFAMAVSSGTIASLRGYRYAPWVWASGLTIATSIGYLRIAADRHYLTDVLVGAAVGSLAGFAVPFLFHRKSEPAEGTGMAPANLTAGPTSFMLTWNL